MHARIVATASKIITQDSQGNYFKPKYGQQHTYMVYITMKLEKFRLLHPGPGNS